MVILESLTVEPMHLKIPYLHPTTQIMYMSYMMHQLISVHCLDLTNGFLLQYDHIPPFNLVTKV